MRRSPPFHPRHGGTFMPFVAASCRWFFRWSRSSSPKGGIGNGPVGSSPSVECLFVSLLRPPVDLRRRSVFIQCLLRTGSILRAREPTSVTVRRQGNARDQPGSKKWKLLGGGFDRRKALSTHGPLIWTSVVHDVHFSSTSIQPTTANPSTISTIK
jgi:hypothetical protein